MHWRSLRGSASCGARPGWGACTSQLGPLAQPPAQPGSIWVAPGRSAAEPAAAELSQDPPLPTPHTLARKPLHTPSGPPPGPPLPSVRLSGARCQHVHTGCGCVHTRITRLQMSPYPPRRCRGGLCMAGPTRWGSVHTHTLTFAHHTVDTPAPHVKALSTAGGVGRHLGTIGAVCTHTGARTWDLRGKGGGAGGVHTCSPVSWGSGVAGGLSKAGLGSCPTTGTRCAPHRPSGSAHCRHSCLLPQTLGGHPAGPVRGAQQGKHGAGGCSRSCRGWPACGYPFLGGDVLGEGCRGWEEVGALGLPKGQQTPLDSMVGAEVVPSLSPEPSPRCR